MPDTAQNQNSINNAQFPYPDFSNQQVSTQPQQVSNQNTLVDEESKLVDLRKSLEDLLEQDKQVPVQPQQNIAPQVDDVKPEEILQDMQSEFNSASSVVPISTPTNFGALERIMPDMKKPRAMNREPKSNNLANLPKSEEEKKEVDDNTPSVSVTTILNSPAPQVPLGDNSSFDTFSNLTIDNLLSESINRNASDLHLSAGYPPIMRVDGELQDLGEKILTPEDVENLVFSVLSDDKKELLEVNREIDFAYTHGGVMNARFRVNAYYSMKNLSAAFRLIPARIRTIEELMLPQIYHQFAKLKQGLILVTGPTGHGKSTTLAAILEDINRSRFSHIVTIEDPIEYVFEGKKALIDQREMNDDTHSWSIALRSALRQDPDVILVGEMRDYETVAAAITLAETGHLVFATLHTNSASQTIDRIVDVFPENQQQQVRTQIANSIQAVVSQRLIPLEQGGRRAVSEIMLNNSAIANLIREGKTFQIDNVIRTSSDVGMMYLEKSLVNLVREGVISVQKAQEYAVHPEEVLRLLKS